MPLTEEEFDNQFKETLDGLVQHMADNSEVSPEAFYHMTCVLENLSFFGPFLYDLLQKPKR
ncbi:MAG: hypothetical protein ICV83_19795 [Cytophagales bacterium]|nr:hypothetical protein [Cytophagales bacterium]